MGPTLVVAPHPDDEVLGCSAVLHQSSVTVVHVTDGVPPWTASDARAEIRSARRTESARAWQALSCTARALPLGFGDLVAWQAVEEVCECLCEVIAAAGAARVFLPAYQRGHPDHDASYLAGAMAHDRLPDDPERTWWVYGLYGFDPERRLRFGWLPPDPYGSSETRGGDDLLGVKGQALRQFASQVWPGSALDRWLREPTAERFAPLPVQWDALPAVPSFYDEELRFGRHGASLAVVESAFQQVLAARAS
ncbi:MAG: PIG-L family deacetylase [Acidimicrobiaceae bacterium]|nr:PIG-L family deacetylase [Acidimicrobiaceae bacterium]